MGSHHFISQTSNIKNEILTFPIDHHNLYCFFNIIKSEITTSIIIVITHFQDRRGFIIRYIVTIIIVIN